MKLSYRHHDCIAKNRDIFLHKHNVKYYKKFSPSSNFTSCPNTVFYSISLLTQERILFLKISFMMHIFAGVLCCDGTSLMYQIRKSRIFVSPIPWMLSCSVISNSSPPHAYSLPGSSVHGISQQEYWSGLTLPSPGDLTQGSNPRLLYLLHWQVGSLPLYHQGRPPPFQVIHENFHSLSSCLSDFLL